MTMYLILTSIGNSNVIMLKKWTRSSLDQEKEIKSDSLYRADFESI
jgi:hypothetical protein